MQKFCVRFPFELSNTNKKQILEKQRGKCLIVANLVNAFCTS